MTDYLHHVPGRLRLRSKILRCDSTTRNMALRKLRALEGVSSVRLNHKAGSVTVSYDADVTDSQEILGLLERHNCLKASAPAIKNRAVTKSRPAKKREWNLTREVGKIAFNVVVSRGVTSLLGGVRV